MSETSMELKGGYFPYCQFCTHDGQCELKHNEFMGVKGRDGEAPFSFKHEGFGNNMTAFQSGNPRSSCEGRIKETGSLFYPLSCSCGTVISSLTLQGLSEQTCRKFKPIEGVDPTELPPLDPNYRAVMNY